MFKIFDKKMINIFIIFILYSATVFGERFVTPVEDIDSVKKEVKEDFLNKKLVIDNIITITNRDLMILQNQEKYLKHINISFKDFKNEFINKMLVVKKAKEEGYDKKPIVKYYMYDALYNYYIGEKIRIPITKKQVPISQLKKYYNSKDKTVKLYQYTRVVYLYNAKDKKEYKTALRTMRLIKNLLKKGEDVNKISLKYIKDIYSKSRTSVYVLYGFDMDPIDRTVIVNLKPGEYKQTQVANMLILYRLDKIFTFDKIVKKFPKTVLKKLEINYKFNLIQKKLNNLYKVLREKYKNDIKNEN